MRLPALMLVGVAVTFMSAAGSQGDANAPRKESTEATQKIKQLQTARSATLKELAEISFTLAKTGRLELAEAIEARMTLLKAEIDVADKPSERITLCTKALESLKQFEEVAQAKLEAARGSALDLLKVKAARLETEILIEHTNVKAAAESK